MNAYEITFIVRPDLDEDQTRSTVEQVTARLEAAQAEIVAALPWTPPRRRMAYPIQDFGDGFYVTTTFRANSDILRDFENALKLNDRILRFLLVQASDLGVKRAEQRLIHQQNLAAAPPPQPQSAAGAPTEVPAAAPPAEMAPTSEEVPAAQPDSAPAGAPIAEESLATEEVPTAEVSSISDSSTPEPETVSAASAGKASTEE